MSTPLDDATPVRIWRDVDRARFETEIVPAGEPAVLKDLVTAWPVVARARQSSRALCEFLREFSLEKPVQTFHGRRDMGGFFNYLDDLQGFNFERRMEPLSALLDLLLRHAQDSDPPFFYAGGVNVPEHLPSFAADHTNPLIAPDTEQLVSIWLGNRTRVPAHWDLPQNIACVVAGRRRFTLFPIEQVPNLYIGPIDVTLAGQPSSLVDLHAPDLERFPRFAEAARHAQCAELEPGDAIYLPSLWVHHVESLESVGALVNFWWRDGPAHMFTPMLTLMHGLLSIRPMPERERHAWRALFDHYVFQEGGDPVAHLPEAARGVLGELTPAQEDNLRKFLASRLLRRPMAEL